jgi:glyoxylase-like metal-dependent hydrolase (beta-lactamase superfamily II)
MTLDGTNTWVITDPDGQVDGALVVDPGPQSPAHLAAVAATGPVHGVLLTHHHPDHAEGLAAFTDLTGARVINPEPGRPLRHGGLTVATVATPGHTADSVSFHVTGAGSAAVFTGDTILGRGSTAVLWPDGNLADYLASLERLATLGPVPALPGHGPIRPNCQAAAREYLAHRHQRLEQVSAALSRGAQTPRDVVEVVYAEVDRSLWPAAEATVRAQLEYLRNRDGEHIDPSRGWGSS